jgi:hypothetical protein
MAYRNADGTCWIGNAIPGVSALAAQARHTLQVTLRGLSQLKIGAFEKGVRQLLQHEIVVHERYADA